MFKTNKKQIFLTLILLGIFILFCESLYYFKFKNIKVDNRVQHTLYVSCYLNQHLRGDEHCNQLFKKLGEQEVINFRYKFNLDEGDVKIHRKEDVKWFKLYDTVANKNFELFKLIIEVDTTFWMNKFIIDRILNLTEEKNIINDIFLKDSIIKEINFLRKIDSKNLFKVYDKKIHSTYVQERLTRLNYLNVFLISLILGIFLISLYSTIIEFIKKY